MYDKLLQYGLRLISKRRYSTFQLRNKLEVFARKLEEKDFTQDVDCVIARLTELGYLDDEKYAKDYISDRVRFRPRGKFMLKKELMVKGLASEIIENILENTDIDEFEIAKEFIKKKWKFLSKFPAQKQKQRIFQTLSSRGFNSDTIYKVVNSYYNSASEDL